MDILKAMKKRRAMYRKELKDLKSRETRKAFTDTNAVRLIGTRVRVLNALIEELNVLIKLLEEPIK